MMGLFIRGSSYLGWPMVKDVPFIRMGRNIQATGLKTGCMVSERRPGRMEQFLQGSSLKEGKMGMENSPETMDPATRVSFLMVISMEKDTICIQIVRNMLGNGRIIKCMGKASSPSSTVGTTVENIKTIRRSDLEFLSGRMGGSTRASERRGSSMERVSTQTARGQQGRDFGMKVKG